MALADRVPGMRPDAPWRNVLVAVGYLVVWPVALAVGVGLLVGRNYRGLAAGLNRLPGINADGGRRTTAVTTLYVFCLVMLVVVAVPADTGTPDQAGGTPAGTDTASLTDTAQPGDAGTGASSTPVQTDTVTDPDGGASVTTQSTPTTTATPNAGQGYRVTIVDVVDGDTMDIRFANGSTNTVRLLGVDTPEVRTDTDPAEWEGVPDTAAGHDCLRAEGEDASEFATGQLAGQTVRFTFDAQADPRGSYGRLLGYLHVDGASFNYRLVADGYARVYDSSFSQRERFYDAEAAAQDRQAGSWRCRNVAAATPTPDDGSRSGTLAVARVHADADGNDHENENDEYVVFTNTGDESLDIAGWTVRDAADHTYIVPSGVTVAPGAEITIYTGSGADSSTALYWGSDSAVWNNDTDTIVVTDASGDRRITYEYS